MTRKVYVVTDLGSGDGGKGGVVHAIATAQRAHTIIKRGGAQGSHGVRTTSGKSFDFSQWGCGTFDGICTHLSHQMVVSPVGLLNEADALTKTGGVGDPFALLTVDETALVTTPFHGIASRLFELALGNAPRGTVGTGVGQAYRDTKRYPELALTVKDLTRPDLYDQLWEVRENIRGYVWPVLEDAEFLHADSADVRHELELLGDDGFLEYTYQRFREAAYRTTIVSHDYLGDFILPRPGVAVVEASHGVLTDRVYGFSPHTSAIRTLPHITRRLLDDAGYNGQIVNLGVTRAYAVRHGAGPLPTANPNLAPHLIPESAESDNRYQGAVRAGALDGVLLRYAINVCGEADFFDGLAVTCFDQVVACGEWATSNRYHLPRQSPAFTLEGELQVATAPSTETQALLTAALEEVTPHITRRPISSALTPDQQYDLCAAQVSGMTGIAVRMVSLGPTEHDKFLK